jgi:NADPH:quinone reductase-like Zn-dependent oxidoreductase
MKYNAYLVEENDGIYNGSIQEIDMQPIEPKNVIIKVHYSSLNYKDALAASGVKGVASSYPFVPGIDVAGEVIESSSDIYNVGDKVIATGYKIGMKVFGGFGELVQLPAEWVLPLPENLSLKGCYVTWHCWSNSWCMYQKELLMLEYQIICLLLFQVLLVELGLLQ